MIRKICRSTLVLRNDLECKGIHLSTMLSPSRKVMLCFLVMEIVISPILQLIIILLLHSLVFEVVGVEGIVEERIGECELARQPPRKRRGELKELELVEWEPRKDRHLCKCNYAVDPSVYSTWNTRSRKAEESNTSHGFGKHVDNVLGCIRDVVT